jgi:alpha-glucosidase
VKRWAIWLFVLGAMVLSGEEYRLLSPDGGIELKIDVGENIRYSLGYRSKPLLLPSPISLTLERGTVLGQKPRLVSTRRQTVDRVIQPLIRQKSRTIREHYNELRLR